PSLFTFNIKNDKINKELQGLSVSNAIVTLSKKHFSSGPLLITHWGFSGPAILKLSAFSSEYLNKVNYSCDFHINWIGVTNTEKVANEVKSYREELKSKQISNVDLFGLPERLKRYIIEKSGISLTKNCADVSNKEINQLVNTLTNDKYHMSGKTTFKEEFVTAGGVSRNEIDFKTMSSRIHPEKVYFCGEVIDIDGITGGYNFQAAWSTAYVCAKSLSRID
ncbi:MAG: aminoacetone oxidase family FAD-binding enzyme, partial [Bacteroidia bacterium]